jgi:sec-independent protein translocase protein TatA
MFGFGHTPEIIILLVVVLLVFGPGKLPEIGGAVGRGIREFKDATNGITGSTQSPTVSQQPPRPIQQPAQDWEHRAEVREQTTPVEHVSADR